MCLKPLFLIASVTALIDMPNYSLGAERLHTVLILIMHTYIESSVLLVDCIIDGLCINYPLFKYAILCMCVCVCMQWGEI